MTDRGLIAGLVLAAGRSVRHPSASKLLLPFRDTTVVRACVCAAAAARLQPIVVVLGHRANEVRSAIGGEVVEFVLNPSYQEGVAGSLSIGIRHLSARSDVEAVAILLGDEPAVSPAVIRDIVEGWYQSGTTVARAVYRDRPGHPVIVDRSLFPRLQGLEGDLGLSTILGSQGIGFHPIPIDQEAPVDIDTPSDYRRATRDRGEDEHGG